MIISEDSNSHCQYHIRSYTPGEIDINGSKYNQSLIISPYELILNWEAKPGEPFQEQDFKKIFALSPAILLLGTGERFIMPHPSLRESIQKHGIGMECMDTRAACQTFIVLSAEGRKVVAALLI